MRNEFPLSAPTRGWSVVGFNSVRDILAQPRRLFVPSAPELSPLVPVDQPAQLKPRLGPSYSVAGAEKSKSEKK